MRTFDGQTRQALSAWLLPVAMGTDKGVVLVETLLEEMRRRQTIIPNLMVVERLAEETRSMINTSWVDANSSAAMSQQSINLTGTKGRVQADQTRRGLRITSDAQGVQDINPYFTSAYESEDGRLVFTGYGIESVLRFVTDTLAVRSGQVSPKQLDSIRPSFRQAFISTAVIEAIDASLRDNSTKKDITSCHRPLHPFTHRKLFVLMLECWYTARL